MPSDEAAGASTRYKGRRSQDVCTSISHECLQQTTFFAGRDRAFLENLVEYLQLEMYVAGDELMKQGEEGDKMYFLHRGAVEVLVGPTKQSVAKLSSGSIFGEMALFGSPRRSATIRATEFCDCRVINHKIFQMILNKFPEERLFFQKMAEERLRKLNEVKEAEADKAKEELTRRNSLPEEGAGGQAAAGLRRRNSCGDALNSLGQDASAQPGRQLPRIGNTPRGFLRPPLAELEEERPTTLSDIVSEELAADFDTVRTAALAAAGTTSPRTSQLVRVAAAAIMRPSAKSYPKSPVSAPARGCVGPRPRHLAPLGSDPSSQEGGSSPELDSPTVLKADHVLRRIRSLSPSGVALAKVKHGNARVLAQIQRLKGQVNGGPDAAPRADN